MKDDIKVEVMQELGIPYVVIHTDTANLPSRLCGYIGSKVNERYNALVKLDIKKLIEKKRED